MEIIVVEGGSRDATRKICSEFSRGYPNIVTVLCEGNSNGKPKTLNLALPHVTGEIVGVFDAESALSSKGAFGHGGSGYGEAYMSGCAFDAYEGQSAGTYGYLSVEELLQRANGI